MPKFPRTISVASSETSVIIPVASFHFRLIEFLCYDMPADSQTDTGVDPGVMHFNRFSFDKVLMNLSNISTLDRPKTVF
jgi:hypothetical protein